MPVQLESIPAVTELMTHQLDQLRRLLVDGLATQQVRAAELRAPIDLEPDLAAVLLDRCHDAMAEINAALVRIGLGSYGTCLGCGSAIPFERLEIIPAAEHCVGCQVERDRLFR